MRYLGIGLLVFVLCGCVRRQPSPEAILDGACVRQCEQIWWACKATCPKDFGGSLGCTIASCNPARNECRATCPVVAYVLPGGPGTGDIYGVGVGKSDPNSEH